MDLIERMREISNDAPRRLEHIKTEEATKNAFVMPFIQALGYNVFDPTEVVPEFTADIGTKKSEKVDYAIIQGGQPIILIEAKSATADLNEEHASQLFRYFSVTEARIGILTNGLGISLSLRSWKRAIIWMKSRFSSCRYAELRHASNCAAKEVYQGGL